MTRKMILVDRLNFMAWSTGELLCRDADGKVLVGDHIDHERAENAMERGEVIGLTHRGVLVSKMRLAAEGFVEFRDKE